MSYTHVIRWCLTLPLASSQPETPKIVSEGPVPPFSSKGTNSPEKTPKGVQPTPEKPPSPSPSDPWNDFSKIIEATKDQADERNVGPALDLLSSIAVPAKNPTEEDLKRLRQTLKEDYERPQRASLDTAYTHSRLGNYLSALGEHIEAEKHYEKAVEICDKPQPHCNRPQKAMAYHNLAMNLYRQGKRLDEAEKLLEEALDICREAKVLGDKHIMTMEISINLEVQKAKAGGQKNEMIQQQDVK